MSLADRKFFEERPTRTETCPRCRGCGTIDDGYALAHTEHVDGAPPKAVCAVVVGASSIFEACREAREIADRAKRPVSFEFNEAIVTVRPGNDADEIARRWWKKTYGETPEQSAARR